MIYIFIYLTSYRLDNLVLQAIQVILEGLTTMTLYNIAVPEKGFFLSFIQCDEG